MDDPEYNFEDTQKARDMLKEAKNTIIQIYDLSHQGLQREGGKEFTRFVKYVDDLCNFYHGFGQHTEPRHEMSGYREELTELVFTKGTYRTVSDVVNSLLRTGNYVTQAEDGTMAKSVFHMKILLAALVDYSSDSEKVQKAMTEAHDFLSALVDTLKAGQEAHAGKELSKTQGDILNSCLRILINCATEGKAIIRLREAGTVEVVSPYLESHNDSIQLDSLRLLARIINEKEAESLLTKTVAIFSLLIDQLGEAREVSDHLKGLIKTLGDLGKSDANKKALVDKGCLPPLVKIVNSEFGNKVEVSLDTMWIVSFEEKNKQKLVDEPNLVERVWKKFNDESSSTEMKNSSYGILWSLSEQLKMGELQFAGIAVKTELQKAKAEMKPTEENQQHIETEPNNDGCFEGPVMISYQWEYQETILKIRQKLKDAGVPVWIDVEFMRGSILETMAKAVEDCSIFIMAACKGYKNSSNCRLEAEYAQKLKKTIIPLMMEQGYEADGWLGIIMGSQLFYDFSGKDPFEDKISELVTVLKEKLGLQTLKTPEPEPEPLTARQIEIQPHFDQQVQTDQLIQTDRQTETDKQMQTDRELQTDGLGTTVRTTQTKKLKQSDIQVQTDRQERTDIVYVQTDRMIYTDRHTQTGEEYVVESRACSLM